MTISLTARPAGRRALMVAAASTAVPLLGGCAQNMQRNAAQHASGAAAPGAATAGASAANPAPVPAMADPDMTVVLQTQWFVQQVTRSPADLQDPRLDIVGRANLAGLPPVTIVSADPDPLRPEGEPLERRLRAAGVDADRRNFYGVTREFFGMTPVVPNAAAAQDDAVGRLVTGTTWGNAGRAPARGTRYQPLVPGAPLNGPATSRVIQPP